LALHSVYRPSRFPSISFIVQFDPLVLSFGFLPSALHSVYRPSSFPSIFLSSNLILWSFHSVSFLPFFCLSAGPEEGIFVTLWSCLPACLPAFLPHWVLFFLFLVFVLRFIR
jgi:hypothetical protein